MDCVDNSMKGWWSPDVVVVVEAQIGCEASHHSNDGFIEHAQEHTDEEERGESHNN